MLNYNGTLINKREFKLNYHNRGFKFGDAIFDTLKFENNIQFIEDHYFRLMSSMRMIRMKIPMTFTLQFYEDEINKTLIVNKLKSVSRVRVTIFRNAEGLYLPKNNDIDFLIEVEPLFYKPEANYEIELYKDFPVLANLLSTIKTNNRLVNVLASIYAHENDFDNCILINEKKSLVDASNANIFLISNNQLITPSLSDGCINGIIRKKIIQLLEKNEKMTLVEKSVSPFELLHADEVFLTNSIMGIQSVHKYRKKRYAFDKTEYIKSLLENISVNLNSDF